jgi:hypothetical protein
MTNAALDQETLFPMPEVERSFMATVEERMAEFIHIANARGGLIPRSAAPELLDLHKSRIQQLVDGGQLEQVSYFGVNFITGRSVKFWKEKQPSKVGRGHKKLSLWKQCVVGVKLGRDIGNAITPE